MKYIKHIYFEETKHYFYSKKKIGQYVSCQMKGRWDCKGITIKSAEL